MNDRPEMQEPAAIKKALDELIVGQETAKWQLGLLLSMHLALKMDATQVTKAHALLIGPTGVGKTHTIRTACKLLGLPHVVVDATSLVQSGIVGEQVEDVLKTLVVAAAEIISPNNPPKASEHDKDIELASGGVIFLDEFDKLAAADGMGREDAASRRLVQRRLLKLIEGSMLRVGVKYHNSDADRFIHTGGMLIIASGAFTGIRDTEVIAKRPPALLQDLYDHAAVSSIDVITFGFIPELVARLPILIEYDELSAAHLLGILRHPVVSPLVVWERYVSVFGSHLDIDDESLRIIAQQAARLRMGARGLQQVLFPVIVRKASELGTLSRGTLCLRSGDFRRRM
jgi:ATP-dependent Clp protease ATP-binding subunit ClpX